MEAMVQKSSYEKVHHTNTQILMAKDCQVRKELRDYSYMERRIRNTLFIYSETFTLFPSVGWHKKPLTKKGFIRLCHNYTSVFEILLSKSDDRLLSMTFLFII